MGVTEQTPPSPGPTQYWQISRLVIPDADASPTSQAATYLVAIYAVGMVSYASGDYASGFVLGVVLAAGVVVGTVSGASRWFRHAPGIVTGAVASVVVFIAMGVLSSITSVGISGGRVILLLGTSVGFFVAGLDWTRVRRLRVVPTLAALPVLIVTASDRGPMLAVALAWLALAVLALWSLECDQRAAFSDPRPLTPAEQGAPTVDSRDLAGALGLALLIGLLFAFSATMPSCSIGSLPGMGRFAGPSSPGGLPFDGPLSLDDLRFGDFDFDGSGAAPEIDINGATHFLRESASGLLYLEHALTGQRFDLRQEGGNLVARDDEGNVYAVIRPADEVEDTSSGPNWWRIAGIAALVALASGLAIWWYRRTRRPPAPPDPREWAVQVVKRIDRLGRSHGAPRAPSETVVHHTEALAADAVPDARLVDVGHVLSDALFGRAEPTMATRLWAEQVVDQVVEAHPPPSRLARRRARTRGRRDQKASERSEGPPTIDPPVPAR